MFTVVFSRDRFRGYSVSELSDVLRKPPFLKKVGTALVALVRRNFEAQGNIGANGLIKWKPLSPATLEARWYKRNRKAGKGQSLKNKKGQLKKKAKKFLSEAKILMDSGIMRQSVSYEVAGDGLYLTSVEYAAYQHYGTDRIPPRPLFPTNENGLPSNVLETIQDAIYEELNAGK